MRIGRPQSGELRSTRVRTQTRYACTSRGIVRSPVQRSAGKNGWSRTKPPSWRGTPNVEFHMRRQSIPTRSSLTSKLRYLKAPIGSRPASAFHSTSTISCPWPGEASIRFRIYASFPNRGIVENGLRPMPSAECLSVGFHLALQIISCNVRNTHIHTYSRLRGRLHSVNFKGAKTQHPLSIRCAGWDQSIQHSAESYTQLNFPWRTLYALR